jgi:secernin
MCDTLVALAQNTAQKVTLFAKNSDRQRNESQVVEFFPAQEYPAGSQLICTYVAIPQARCTHAVVLCRPFWIWGAEMGANDRGVVIGNEGLLSRSAAPEEESLTGMDLVRIGLERASTAAEAVDILGQLLDQYGQGGNCGHPAPNYYNNGFLIADPREAFVLETVGAEWVSETVQGWRSISNGYSIGPAAERTSAGFPDLLRKLRTNSTGSHAIPELLANPQTEHLGQAESRRARSALLLHSQAGSLDFAAMTRILRDHGPVESSETPWTPRSPLGRTLCMHAGSQSRQGQTTGSMVSELHRQRQVHWVTGTAAPCLSLFKPVMLDVPIPPYGSRPGGQYDASSLWWRHERLHRAALLEDFPEFLRGIQDERESLEADFHGRMTSVREGGSVVERQGVIAWCWKEAIDAENRWFSHLRPAVSAGPMDPYAVTWAQMNKLAEIEDTLVALADTHSRGA